MRRLGILLFVLLLALPASAEIYRWTDSSGRANFAQDLNQVPAQYRRQAENNADASKASPSTAPRVQTYRGSTSTAPAAAARSARSTNPAGGDVHRIRVSRAGTSMMVNVRLNGSVTAPFIIDTGASDVLVPLSVAKRLGLELGPQTRTKRYSTANGIVEHPVVMLRSVSLGTALVKDVPASVSPNMNVGLLGLSFFNHFTYNIDAASGIVTLKRNGLASTGKIRGGRSQAQWSSEFRSLLGRIRWVEHEFENKAEAKSRVRRQLEEERERLDQQFAQLEEEADRARVPMAWRR